MHTTTTTYDGTEISVVHNGDWSGLATLVISDEDRTLEIEVPASVIFNLAIRVTGDMLSRLGDSFYEEAR